jgi:hypothetical protein
VLELNGKNSYVELPSTVFNYLGESTMEGWVKWGALDSYSRFFDVGVRNHALLVANRNLTGELYFGIHLNSPVGQMADSFRLLQLDQWCHIAAVSGPGGMKLYYNGVLVGTYASTESFSILQLNVKPTWASLIGSSTLISVAKWTRSGSGKPSVAPNRFVRTCSSSSKEMSLGCLPFGTSMTRQIRGAIRLLAYTTHT